MYSIKYNWLTRIFKFCFVNNIRLIYTGTSIFMDQKNENLSPYAWTKTHNINLLKNLKMV